MTRHVLLAPWRMKYLEGAKLSDCFLCKALSQSENKENLVLVKTHLVGVVLNRYPYNNGHIMIVPIQHVPSFIPLEIDVLSELSHWIRISEKILREVYDPDGFNIGVNLGSAGGAGLDSHLHIHMMPRWSGDTNFITTCGELRVIPELLSNTYDRLIIPFQNVKDAPSE